MFKINIEKQLFKKIMSQWLPLSVLLDVAVKQLPSPHDAQKYRVKDFYTGPQTDDVNKEFFSRVLISDC